MPLTHPLLRVSAAILVLLILATGLASPLLAQPYVVTDASFTGGVYDFLYRTSTNTADNGGVPVAGDPWLTNTGWVRDNDFENPPAHRWKLPPAYVRFTPRYTGAGLSGTVGFDFSAVSGAIDTIEINPAQYLFTYFGGLTPPGTCGDLIVGEVATPTSFGGGPWTTIYTLTGTCNGTPGAVFQGNGLLDITSLLPPSWLADPGLIEFRFSYSQTTPIASPGCSTGCAEPAGPLAENVQLFRDTNGSNKGFQLVATLSADSDGDGVGDAEDLCPDTLVPESVPTVRLGTNRWALTDGDGIFDTTHPGEGHAPDHGFTTSETGGCSCEQIIELLDLGRGHAKFGCSGGALDDWLALLATL